MNRFNQRKELHKSASKASSKKAKGLNWDAAEAELKGSELTELSADEIRQQMAADPLFSEEDIQGLHAIQLEEDFRKILNSEEAAFVEMGAFLTDSLNKLSLIKDYLISEKTSPGGVSAAYNISFSNLGTLKVEFKRLDLDQEKWHREAAEAQSQAKEEEGEFSRGYMTNDVVHDFGDGWKVVYVPAVGEGPNYKGDPNKSNDRTVEGNLNGLCLGSTMGLYQNNKNGKIYSVRDSSNKPRVTIRIQKITSKRLRERIMDLQVSPELLMQMNG